MVPRPDDFEPPGLGMERVAQVPMPEIFPHPEARDLLANGGQVALNLAAGAVVLCQFQVPGGRVGVLRDVNIQVNAMLGTTNVRFRLRQAGAIIPGWGDMTIAPRIAASVTASSLPESTLVRIGEGALLTLEAQVLDAGAYDVYGSFHGWHYSTALEQRFRKVWAV